jgi:hypothetical protein
VRAGVPVHAEHHHTLTGRSPKAEALCSLVIKYSRLIIVIAIQIATI